MPKGKVDVPITDQEIRFAHLLLAGEMTDCQAAAAVGISAAQAAYVKAKPRVKEYMAEHRKLVRAAVAKHEAKTLIQFNITRPQLLNRLWEIANLDAQETNGSMNAQVLAVKELFVRTEGELPGPERPPPFYRAAWMGVTESGQA